MLLDAVTRALCAGATARGRRPVRLRQKHAPESDRRACASLHDGSVHWAGRDLDEHDLAPNEIGYVPQFGIAFDLLTVGESVETALRLRVGGLSAEERAARTAAFSRARSGWRKSRTVASAFSPADKSGGSRSRSRW